MISGSSVGALRNSLSCWHVRLENRRDQEWLTTCLNHQGLSVWSGQRTEPTITPKPFPWLEAYLGCFPAYTAAESQARPEATTPSAGLVLVAWILAFSDFLDFGVSLPLDLPIFPETPCIHILLRPWTWSFNTQQSVYHSSTLGNSEPWILLSFRSRMLTLLISNSLLTPGTCLCSCLSSSF